MADTDMDVLVVGSAIVDFICYAPRLPKPGETLHGTKFEKGYGGKGANQCVAAARLGAKAALVACVGGDNFGRDYVDHLRGEKINLEHVQMVEGLPTGIAQIAVSDSGENNIIIVVGANRELNREAVIRAHELLIHSKILVCQLETPVETTITALKLFNGISIVNASPALKETPKELLERASIICVNESEAKIMTELENVDSVEEAKVAVALLLSKGANVVILTMGKLGAVFGSKETPTKCEHVPAPKVENVVDTTGAGDAFIGALSCNMARFPDRSLKEHIETANFVASLSVKSRGTQSSFPYKHEINV